MTNTPTQGGESVNYRKRLRHARKEANLTLTELAAKLPISVQAISQLELEKQHATMPTLQGIADALGVRMCWLVTGEGKMWR